jgi:hypothetical protein
MDTNWRRQRSHPHHAQWAPMRCCTSPAGTDFAESAVYYLDVCSGARAEPTRPGTSRACMHGLSAGRDDNAVGTMPGALRCECAITSAFPGQTRLVWAHVSEAWPPCRNSSLTFWRPRTRILREFRAKLTALNASSLSCPLNRSQRSWRRLATDATGARGVEPRNPLESKSKTKLSWGAGGPTGRKAAAAGIWSSRVGDGQTGASQGT